jgi:hypothetical protein
MINTITDAPIIRKSGSALFKDGEVNPNTMRFVNYETFGLVSRALPLIRRIYGGYWVGGILLVYKDRLLFRANAFNQAFFMSDMMIEIPMSAITAVAQRYYILFGIVDVAHGDLHFKFRCSGSRELAQTLIPVCPSENPN